MLSYHLMFGVNEREGCLTPSPRAVCQRFQRSMHCIPLHSSRARYISCPYERDALSVFNVSVGARYIVPTLNTMPYAAEQ